MPTDERTSDEREALPRMGLTLKDKVRACAEARVADVDQEDAFMVMDVDDVVQKARAWRRLLPRVEPFYAVKCHDDERVMRALAEDGVGFDCASKAEINKVINIGVAPERIIYANPCKAPAHLRFARKQNVKMMTFDNQDELYKIKEICPDAELLLRLLPDDSDAVCRLGVKFGCDLVQVPGLLSTARDLGLNVVGMAFHVGSGCQRITAFSEAVHLARRAFDIAADLGMPMRILDIGGGFPGNPISTWASAMPDDMVFPNVATDLRATLDDLFPAESGVRLIAEPGRYMVHSAGTLFVNVIARRTVVDPEEDLGSSSSSMCSSDVSGDATRGTVRFYVNDGVYGSFNNIIYDHAVVEGFPFYRGGAASEGDKSELAGAGPSGSPEEAQTMVQASVWGPTCDGLDCILENATLPVLELGDWMAFPNMGAYTIAAASAFNGFEVTQKTYV